MWTKADLTKPVNVIALNGKPLSVTASETGWDDYTVTYFSSGPVIVSSDRALQILNAYAPKGTVS